MELKQNAVVVNADGAEVGHIDRVVLNPQTKEITAIVVRKGLFFTHDKVVPMAMVDTTTSNGSAMLRANAADLDDLQDYQSEYYVPADEENEQNKTAVNDIDSGTTTNSVYPYPAYGVPWPGTLALGAGGTATSGFGEPQVVRKTQINIAENEVALKKGAKVLASNGDTIGTVDEVLTDSDSRRATHFVLSHGMLFKTRKLIPMDWVRNVAADDVELVVGARALEQLRDYNDTDSGPEVPIF